MTLPGGLVTRSIALVYTSISVGLEISHERQGGCSTIDLQGRRVNAGAMNEIESIRSLMTPSIESFSLS